jgi:uncharacterized RDD family membrane protein YckC
MVNDLPVELAGFWRRFGASLVDVVWMLPLSILLALVGSFANRGELSTGGELMANVILGIIVVSFWAERRATPGKLVAGIRIVDAETGGTPPVGRLVLRYVGYIVSGIPLCLGYLWMLWDGRKQTWHDKMAGTLVIRERR